VPDLTIKLKTLTPLWTGGVDQTCERLHETGLIGSLRWWYEALVRGLGGYACDPTDDSPCRDTDHCAACELFGCTGWSRKFRLQALGTSGGLISSPLSKGAEFALRFVELRHLCAKEQWLLAKAVETAAKWGSIGGRTTRKPQARHGVGDDYGLISLKNAPTIECSPDTAKTYLNGFPANQREAEYPDLRCFFFVQGAFLWREEMNTLMQREPFLRGDRGAGNKPAVSKKVFSFRADSGRIWGFARNAKMRDEVIASIGKLLHARRERVPVLIKTGQNVINEL
jgi:CRISPR-associated protein Cmr1